MQIKTSLHILLVLSWSVHFAEIQSLPRQISARCAAYWAVRFHEMSRSALRVFKGSTCRKCKVAFSLGKCPSVHCYAKGKEAYDQCKLRRLESGKKSHSLFKKDTRNDSFQRYWSHLNCVHMQRIVASSLFYMYKWVPLSVPWLNHDSCVWQLLCLVTYVTKRGLLYPWTAQPNCRKTYPCSLINKD